MSPQRTVISPLIATAVTTALTASLAASLAATGTATAHAAPADVAPAGIRARVMPDTELTLRIGRCEGCEVGLASYHPYPAAVGEPSVTGTVTDGRVTFTVPSQETSGLSLTVRAPWQGDLGYLTYVAFRYNRTDIGDRVRLRDARTKRWASGCWAGTVNDAVTLRVKVRRVRVRGVEGRTPGLIAWAPDTESWLKPMVRARRGVLGRQDALPCVSG